jgi:BolA protein
MLKAARLTRRVAVRSVRTMTVQDTLRAKLTAALHPTRLEIVDESHLHAGHAGARPEGETHFRIEIVSEAFAGQSRVARQRLVYDILAEELRTRVHALALITRTPHEASDA